MRKKCPKEKWLPVEEGIIEGEYEGYMTSDKPNSQTYCSIVYKGNGIGWCWNRENDVVEHLTHLRTRLTLEEQEQWRIDNYEPLDPKEQLNLMGLFNDMYDVGDAYHEMYNAWTSFDWYEMSENLYDESFFLVGVAPAPYECFAFDESIAFVCEEPNGTRLWCHGSKDWVTRMREQMKSMYNMMMGIEEYLWIFI